MVDSPPLSFTAHCQVRYVERFLDKDAVSQARRRYKSDALILESLQGEFGADLRHFRHVIQVAYFNLLHRAGEFIAKTPYRLRLGKLCVFIRDGQCLTTVCKHRDVSRSGPFDDDPMEQKQEPYRLTSEAA